MEPPSYRGYRFPAGVIGHCVWLYHRFALSLCDVEELMLERGVEVTYETIRQWSITFGPDYARRLRRRRPKPGDKWRLDTTWTATRAATTATAHRDRRAGTAIMTSRTSRVSTAE